MKNLIFILALGTVIPASAEVAIGSNNTSCIVDEMDLKMKSSFAYDDFILNQGNPGKLSSRQSWNSIKDEQPLKHLNNELLESRIRNRINALEIIMGLGFTKSENAKVFVDILSANANELTVCDIANVTSKLMVDLTE